jgi:Rrf2 family transcriptional regulator, iron-sulfur cluster assembly transcription factor
MFSKACEYAIRAAIHLARKSMEGQRASLIDIANEIDSPQAFTSKILQQLVNAGIIFSTRGQKGGFGIESTGMKTKTIADIVSAIDGSAIFENCGLGLKECSGKQPCPVHKDFVKIREELRIVLENTTIVALATSHKDGLTYLKR